MMRGKVREVSRGWVMRSFVVYKKRVKFYPKCSGKPLNVFEQQQYSFKESLWLLQRK